MSPSSAEKPLIRGLTYPEVVQRSLYSMFEFGCSRVGRDAEAILYFGNRITYPPNGKAVSLNLYLPMTAYAAHIL